MTEQEIISFALKNLQLQTEIEAKWEPVDPRGPDKALDGYLFLQWGKNSIKYYAEVKTDLQRLHFSRIEELARKYSPFIVVAARIYPKIKKELRNLPIAYLEANGNVFLKEKESLIWIDSNKLLDTEEKIEGRAFTKAGLKIVFQFLLEEQWVNLPYREIAIQTGTSIGNITYIMKDLKQAGYLLPVTKNEWQLHNKKALLEQWSIAYDKRLKPSLKIGTYRFLKETDFNDWKKLMLQKGKTWWGGEAAGALLTNHLYPELLTLYTTESPGQVMKNYRLVPDEEGNILVYQKFWQGGDPDSITVPPLLAYVELHNMHERRCEETAKKIYDAFLQDKI